MDTVGTVFVPAAGTGSRLRPLTDAFPKALIAVNRKPAISYVIDLYPATTRFVIAVGHKAEQVRDYLAFAYPDRDLRIVTVSRYEGPGAGLGLTIAESAHLLDAPFVFHAVDSLLVEPWWTEVTPGADTIVVADPPEFTGVYRCAQLGDGERCAGLSEPTETPSPGWLPYLGVSRISRVDRFAAWAATTTGEFGESSYLRSAIAEGVSVVRAKGWYDLGSPTGLEFARAELELVGSTPNAKLNDVTYFHREQVIKVHAEPGIAELKRIRGQALGASVPALIAANDHCLSYRKVPGEPLSEQRDPTRFLPALLTWLHDEFWTRAELDQQQARRFRASCDRFYRRATTARINALPERLREQRVAEVDGVRVENTLAMLAATLPWDRLADGVAVRWHGDLHANNILRTDDGFALIDWRDDFGGMTPPWGDLYYELAKLLHGYVLPDAIIDGGEFSVTSVDTGGGSVVRTVFAANEHNPACVEILRQQVIAWGWDWNLVVLIGGLVFLRMSPLYPRPETVRLLWATGIREVSKAAAALGWQ
jgi:hypothetical protein